MIDSFGMSLINADARIAGAVFLFAGSKTILNSLILYFLRCFFTSFKYLRFVLIIGESNVEDLISLKSFT